MNSSEKIKTGFILAITSQVAVDTFFIGYILENFIHIYFMSSNTLIYLSLLLMLVVAPFVLAIVATNYVKNEVPDNGKDKTFRLIAKILSTVTIIETAALFTIALLYGALIGTIVLTWGNN